MNGTRMLVKHRPDGRVPYFLGMVSLVDFYVSKPNPMPLKMDVEDHETEVVQGAQAMLAKRRPLGLLVELAGCGTRYGFDEAELHQRLVEFGYTASSYTALKRSLEPFDPALRYVGSANVLYVRDLVDARHRVHDVPEAEYGAYII